MTATFSVKAKNPEGMNCEFTLTDDNEDKLLIRIAKLFIWLKDAGFEAYFPPIDKVAKAEPVGVPVNPPKGEDVKPRLVEDAQKMGAKVLLAEKNEWCEKCGCEKKFKLRHGAKGDFYSHAFQVDSEWVYHNLKEE